jgi:hypothetical protein
MSLELAVSLPADWWELPLDRDAGKRAAAICELVDNWVSAAPSLASQRASLVSLLGELARAAAASGAVIAAQHAIASADGLVSANLTVAVQQADSGVGPLAGLGEAVGSADLQSAAEAPASPVRVHMPHAPDARRASRWVKDESLGLDVLVVEYRVPTFQDRQVVVMAFSARCPTCYEREMERLFDLVAATLRLGRNPATP